MLITREMLIKRLSEKSGYWQKDILSLLRCLDSVVLECFDEVTEDEDVMVQILSGLKIGCSIVPERERVDPRDRTPIVCPPTCKLSAKFTQGFKDSTQQQYEAKKGE